ncbi:hypothetical protein [Nocardioides sp. B-3]
MVFEIPDNLHPNCAPVARLLGTGAATGTGTTRPSTASSSAGS